jgi:hypothetical protein
MFDHLLGILDLESFSTFYAPSSALKTSAQTALLPPPPPSHSSHHHHHLHALALRIALSTNVRSIPSLTRTHATNHLQHSRPGTDHAHRCDCAVDAWLLSRAPLTQILKPPFIKSHFESTLLQTTSWHRYHTAVPLRHSRAARIMSAAAATMASSSNSFFDINSSKLLLLSLLHPCFCHPFLSNILNSERNLFFPPPSFHH